MITASVCIITYNHEPFIAQAIEGALMQQTSFPFEIVIGEDDSRDKTRQIVKEYAQRYPDKIRLFLNDRKNVIYINGRPTGRWNFVNVLKQARGKYIALCDGDDYWTDPTKLQKQVAFLEANPEYSGAFHETQAVLEDGTTKRYYGHDIADKLLAEDTIALTSPFHTSSFVFRRDALEFPAWFSRVASGDMALFSIVAAHGPLGKVPGVMSVYRIQPGGITSTPEAKRRHHEQRIQLIHYLNEFHNFHYDVKAREVIGKLGSQKRRLQREASLLRRLRRTLRLRTRIGQLLRVKWWAPEAK
jgi:glycosyltransferase involved in cell wall biosynthesis